MVNEDNAQQDIPYGEDLCDPADATAWMHAADLKRPHRALFRSAIAEHISLLGNGLRVLELGSGPGLLAEVILARCENVERYTLLDFSEPMLAMSRQRVSKYPAASVLCADFRSDDWVKDSIGSYDCVVSMQAVHEVRHKRHVPSLYAKIHDVTRPGATVAICDHTPSDNSLKSTSLFMTEAEQLQALAAAGFINGRVLLAIKGLLLYVCNRG